ncbi:MAG: carbohydrate kinase family protein [Patescibacteria group bacterium]|nr:carbohydrate kinase family protein [Patescibacteria group bacterium]MDE1944615.1 carbohydrate kinase family protein [Patescibacteria group bacterium]MDE1944668.1 carbohydrate kinase family protein [Patescibacteria group bacterium]MDE2057354.1 carbohydrate kinase family protein [Patescibacteria group bacterium]
MDFLAIGDTTVDEFIRLKDARVNCDLNDENCTISMNWGDKIPYEFSVRVAGVGNAANAAVAAARLGLATGFLSNVGGDDYGKEIIATFERERVDTRFVRVNAGVATNHDYVLWFEAERTILVRHEDFAYAIPEDLPAPKWIYLSSAGRSLEFHLALADWCAKHPETKLAFQPSTFEMALGVEKLAPLYRAAAFVACNKEEAERILALPAESEPATLLEKLRALGPEIAIVTDGPKGAYAADSTGAWFVPMYPDPKPPYERTGAGDACTSTIVAALALGKPLAEALLWGPVNSMAVVQEIGAQKGLLARDALEKLLAEAPASYAARPL